MAPLLSAIDFAGTRGRRSHPRVVRLLVDAGVDTTSAVERMNDYGGAFNIPLGFTNRCLREKTAGGLEADEE